MINKIKIELTESDCEIFKWAMEYYDIFKEAREKLKPGSLTLHFNARGEIGNYEFHVYPQKKKFTPIDF